MKTLTAIICLLLAGIYLTTGCRAVRVEQPDDFDTAFYFTGALYTETDSGWRVENVNKNPLTGGEK